MANEQKRWRKRKGLVTVCPVELHGDAATAVYDYQEQKYDNGEGLKSKAETIQILLCELYKLKQKEK